MSCKIFRQCLAFFVYFSIILLDQISFAKKGLESELKIEAPVFSATGNHYFNYDFDDYQSDKNIKDFMDAKWNKSVSISEGQNNNSTQKDETLLMLAGGGTGDVSGGDFAKSTDDDVIFYSKRLPLRVVNSLA